MLPNTALQALKFPVFTSHLHKCPAYLNLHNTQLSKRWYLLGALLTNRADVFCVCDVCSVKDAPPHLPHGVNHDPTGQAERHSKATNSPPPPV